MLFKLPEVISVKEDSVLTIYCAESDALYKVSLKEAIEKGFVYEFDGVYYDNGPDSVGSRLILG